MEKLNNIFAYIIGNLRYQAYYSKHFKWLLRDIIVEQIDWRIKIMKAQCFKEGSCIKCGCTTTQLQMANKNCDGLCYPPMMGKKYWENFCRGRKVKIGRHYWHKIVIAKGDDVAMIKVYRNDVRVHVKTFEL